jgi:hypothetical protein
VSETIAADPAATAALWGNLLSQDLISEFHARMRPMTRCYTCWPTRAGSGPWSAMGCGSGW